MGRRLRMYQRQRPRAGRRKPWWPLLQSETGGSGGRGHRQDHRTTHAPNAKSATAMATMATAMATASAKPSMRGVLGLLIASNNIARRHMHAGAARNRCRDLWVRRHFALMSRRDPRGLVGRGCRCGEHLAFSIAFAARPGLAVVCRGDFSLGPALSSGLFLGRRRRCSAC